MDVSKLCRSCMKEVASWEVGNFDQRAVDMFIFCTNIEVTNEDKLPKQFCYDCTIKVESAYTFIKKSQEVNITLKNLLSRNLTSVIVEPDSQIKSFTEVPFNEHLYSTLSENSFFNNIDSNSNTDITASYGVSLQEKTFYPNQEDVNGINNDFQNNKACGIEQSRYMEREHVKEHYIEENSCREQNTKEAVKVCPICDKAFESETWYINHVRNFHKETVIYTNNIDLNLQNEQKNVNIVQNLSADHYRNSLEANSEIITYNMSSNVQLDNRNEFNRTPDITDLLSENVMEKENEQNNTDVIENLNGEKTKEDSKKLACPICKKGFVLEGWLQKHMLKKHNAPAGSKEIITQKSDQKVPTDIQYKELKKCPLCVNEFSSKLWLTKHLEDEHRDSKVYLCSLCYSPFLTHQELRSHPCPERRFACPTCGKRFRKRKQLTAHATAHRTARPFACHKCDRRFKVKSVLMGHMKLHDSTRPYLCHVCGDSFRVSSTLECHMRRHTGTRPYVCGTCGYRAGALSTLHVHMRRHRRHRPHRCNSCAATFIDTATLVRHERIHTGARPYSCSACGARFPDTWKCKLHMMRAHKMQLHQIPRITMDKT